MLLIFCRAREMNEEFALLLPEDASAFVWVEIRYGGSTGPTGVQGLSGETGPRRNCSGCKMSDADGKYAWEYAWEYGDKREAVKMILESLSDQR